MNASGLLQKGDEKYSLAITGLFRNDNRPMNECLDILRRVMKDIEFEALLYVRKKLEDEGKRL